MKQMKRQNRGKRRSLSLLVPLPVLLAACLFLLAAGCLAQHRLSAKRQGAEFIRELYTADRGPMLKELAAANITKLYEKRLGQRMTEQGQEALSGIGVPYSLLFREFSAPVERTYMVSVQLEEEEGKKGSQTGGGAQAPEEEEPQKDAVSFRYTAEVDFYLEKGLEVLAPIEREVFSGTIRLKKSGFFGWKLDGFTVG